ncbi:MAG: UDP-2,3-diacylglucosamine diphosphatase [Pseudobdellovibrio sp.]
MKNWFISDLHLQDPQERNGNTLLRFLFELNKNPKENRLFLLGDIFDVWVSDGSAFVNKFKIIIDEIVKLKNNGGEVYYFEGNHDVHLAKFWTDRFQIPVFTVEQFFDLEGLKVRIEHGDYINPDDKTYIKWLKILRSPPMALLAHAVPSSIWNFNANKYSKKSRKKTARYSAEHSEKIRKLIRQYANTRASEAAFDVIVTGHMHVFDDYEFAVHGRSFRSINLGTWLEKPRVLKIENRKIEIINL